MVTVKRAPNTDRNLGWETFWLQGLFLTIPLFLSRHALSSGTHRVKVVIRSMQYVDRIGSSESYRPTMVIAQPEGKHMSEKRRIDWEVFWLREVLILALPTLSAVLRLPKGGYLHTAGLILLIVILFCLTMFNLSWAWFRRSQL